MRSASRVLTRPASFGLAALLLLAAVGASADSRLYPLPAAETVSVVSRWLRFEGYALSQGAGPNGETRIEARRGEETWTVAVAPASPLASRVAQQFARAGRPDPGEGARLEKHLDRYVAGDAAPGAGLSTSSGQVPPAVRDRAASVVCLSAQREGREPVRFTGFLVGRGLIVATGHDLDDVQRVRVAFSGGRKPGEGRMLRRDAARDLSLIRLQGTVESPVVPLSEGRDLLSGGESLYAIGCPGGDTPAVRDGFVSGPPVKADGQPLWPVEIETLPGSSGGPVFDSAGRIAGLVKGRVRGTETRGFVIPVRTIVEFIKGRAE